MRQRLLMGPVLIGVLVASLWLDELLASRAVPGFLGWTGWTAWPRGFVASLVGAVAVVFASRELASILAAKGVRASAGLLALAGLVGLVIMPAIPGSVGGHVAGAIVASGAIVLFAASLVFHARHKNPAGVIASASATLLAYVYLGLMLSFVLLIRREHPAWVLLWVILVTKSCDIGAYFTGKAIGRHKLILWLSPGKTWEGLFGGIVLSCVAAVAGLWMLREWGGVRTPALVMGLVPGVLFAVVGQAGDLIMSLFKRDAGLKDSGRVLPGMGGVLDVIDSPLLVGPLAYWWLRAAMGGADPS